jgi:predicted dehydrogenase
MRFGLVGTGYWARVTHAAGIIAEPNLELAGIWGRNPESARALAAGVGVRAFAELDEMFDNVDAIAFAVPPHVQVPIAMRAAEAGKHLLLEKPIATSSEDAARLEAAVDAAGVASVVFFTGRFEAAEREWMENAARRDDWDGGWALWLGSAFAPGSPFDTPWRHEKGGLWDVGPHAISMLSGALGRIVEVTARPGRRDLVHLVLRHESGATSTASVTLEAPIAASGTWVTIWGPAGQSQMPVRLQSSSAALSTAARELVAAAGQPRPGHPCDVHFGRTVVDLLAEAERQVIAARLQEAGSA